jgi:hypothetical protein
MQNSHSSAAAPSAATLALYRGAFQEHGRTEEALLWGKNKQSVRFAALCRHIADGPVSLLDYGCGLGDLIPWLRAHRPTITYTGADAVGAFIVSNREALPDHDFRLITVPSDVIGRFDHVVCSGIFNLNPDRDHESHWRHVRETLLALFAKTKISLHIDFLAHDTDFRKPSAYHQDTKELVSFVETHVSRRYCLDRTYMPYEFCISIFADREIARDRNVYAAPPRP